jgi:hypothetical protein
VDAHIEKKAQESEKEVTYQWLKRGDEKFLRAVVAPVTIEVVFYDDRIELFGAAPAWAKLLLAARKTELKDWVEEILLASGFIKGSVPEVSVAGS